MGMWVEGDYVEITCWKCKTRYCLPRVLYTAAKASDDISFHCPYGHSAHYPSGPTDEDKLRQERDRLRQQLAQKDDEISRQRDMREGVERRLSAAKGQVTKIKNRVGHGICPCCSRSFENLARHMASKHAGYAKSGDGDTATVN